MAQEFGQQRAAVEGLTFEREVFNLLLAAGHTLDPVVDPVVDFRYTDPEHGRVAVVAFVHLSVDRARLIQALLERLDYAVSAIVVVYRRTSAGGARLVQEIRSTDQRPILFFDRDSFADWLGVPRSSTSYGTALAAAFIRSDVPPPTAGDLHVSNIWARLPKERRDEAARATDLDAFLRIGDEIEDLTFVLSDIENYSTIVGKARRRDLVPAMGRIYRESRNAVLKHGGFLVGFTGDSVLAVFDYPTSQADQNQRAIRCAADLVAVARPVLDTLLGTLNGDIPTGTRVAVTNGDALVIDAGIEAPDPQFVSDAINLAARLQHQASSDGLVVDNRTQSQLRDADEPFWQGLGAVRTSVGPEVAKGQGTAVIYWEVAPATLTTLRGGSVGHQ